MVKLKHWIKLLGSLELGIIPGKIKANTDFNFEILFQR